MNLRFSLASALLAGLAIASTGCGYSAADFCEDLCDCISCGEKELDSCIYDREADYEEAVDAGCEDVADEYLSCLSDEAECIGDEYRVRGCDDELEAVGRCMAL